MENQIPEQESKPAQQFDKKLSLSFIDKDEKENAKFNDARLVDILRNYPLLYNKSLESYGDPDYTQWMWGEIANEMNEPHRKTTLSFPFNWTDCRDQWQTVKRALHYLSNPAAKNFRYPKQFRECLEFFQNYIKDRREKTELDRSQDLFLNNTNLLEQLPFEKQLSLEKEVLDALLSHELEFCAPMVDPGTCEAHAREEFGKVIGLLMPEVDLQIVKTELATETDPFNVEDLVQSNENENTNILIAESVTDVTQLLDLYEKSGISLKRTGSHLELDNLLQVPSKRVEFLLAQPNIQYSVQDVTEVNPDQIQIVQNIIEENVIEEDIAQEVSIQQDGTQEVVLQECVFQEDGMQEDLIEEVVPQGPGKDMPSLDIDGNFESQVNRLDFTLF